MSIKNFKSEQNIITDIILSMDTKFPNEYSFFKEKLQPNGEVLTITEFVDELTLNKINVLKFKKIIEDSEEIRLKMPFLKDEELLSIVTFIFGYDDLIQ